MYKEGSVQVVDLCHSDTTVHTIGVVGNLTLAEVGLDAALGIVGRDAEEGKGTLADLCVDCAEGVQIGRASCRERVSVGV